MIQMSEDFKETSRTTEDDQRWIDTALERSWATSAWRWQCDDSLEAYLPFIGPVLPNLCEACGEAIQLTTVSTRMGESDVWLHVSSLPVGLGHTAVPEPF
jgi:hypothetical protein